MVGITGSNGKSTVTACWAQMAAAAGVVAVGGNLGTPALDLLDDEVDPLRAGTVQLPARERSWQAWPGLAAVLNLSADHMDRHRDMQAYHAAKHGFSAAARRWSSIATTGCRPLQADAATCLELHPGRAQGEALAMAAGHAGRAGWPGVRPLMPAAEVGMVGPSQPGQRPGGAGARRPLLGLPDDAMLEELRELSRGLPHRSHLVAEVNGLRWVNDSKATNPGATAGGPATG